MTLKKLDFLNKAKSTNKVEATETGKIDNNENTQDNAIDTSLELENSSNLNESDSKYKKVSKYSKNSAPIKIDLSEDKPERSDDTYKKLVLKKLDNSEKPTTDQDSNSEFVKNLSLDSNGELSDENNLNTINSEMNNISINTDDSVGSADESSKIISVNKVVTSEDILNTSLIIEENKEDAAGSVNLSVEDILKNSSTVAQDIDISAPNSPENNSSQSIIDNSINNKASSSSSKTNLSSNEHSVVTEVSDNASVSHSNEELTKVPFAKINPIKMPASEVIDGSNNNSVSTDISQTEIVEVEATAKLSFLQKVKKRLFSTSKSLDVNQEYLQKVDTVFKSVTDLFLPFKEVLLKTVPASIYIIKPLAWFFRLVIFIARVIVLRVPRIIYILKTIYFKIFIVLIIFLFIFGAICSRVINSPSYVKSLEVAIYNSTGYRASITGVIKLSLLPRVSISLKNVTLSNDKNGNLLSKFHVSNFSADSMVLRFKFLPSLIGVFQIDQVELRQLSLTLQSDRSAKDLTNYNYNAVIQNIETVIKTRLDKDILEKEKQEKKNLELKGVNGSKLINNIQDLIENVNTNPDKIENTLSNLPNTNSKDKADDTVSEEDNLITENGNTVEDGDVSLREQVSFSNAYSDKKSQSGALYAVFSRIINNLHFKLSSVDSVKISQGSIRVLNSKNKVIASLNGINALISSHIGSTVTMTGTLRYLEKEFNFNNVFEFNKDHTLMNFVITDLSSDNSFLSIESQEDNKGVFTGQVSASNDFVGFLVSNIFVPIDYEKSDIKFNSDFILNATSLKLNKFEFSNDDSSYSGSFVWNYGNKNPDASLNLNVKAPRLENIINDTKSGVAASIIKDNTFLAVVDSLQNWKSRTISKLQVHDFRVSVNIDKAAYKSTIIDNLKTDFFINENNVIYINNFYIKSGSLEAEILGKVALNNKTGSFFISTSGDIESFSRFVELPNSTTVFLRSIAKDKDSYHLESKLVFDNTRVVFNEVQGLIGERALGDTYVLLNEHINNTDVLISTVLPSLNMLDLNLIYNSQINLASGDDEITHNLFGVSDKFDFSLNIKSDNFQYHNLKFKNANLEIGFINSGFLLKKIDAQGIYGGSIVASFNADTNLNPKIAGNINFNDYIFKLEDVSDFMFENQPLVGNVVLNGHMRFSGSDYNNPFVHLDGDVNFIKQERLQLSRYAITDGIYMTVSKKKVNKVDKFFLNDLYGVINVKDGKVDFYPVFLNYIIDNQSHRGTFEGSYDLLTRNLGVKGELVNDNNPAKKIEFKFSGDILNPKMSQQLVYDKSVNYAKNDVQKVDVLKKYARNNKVMNNLNNQKNKDYFNNNYNLQVKTKREEEIKSKSYDDIMEKADKSKVYNFDDSYKERSYPKHNNLSDQYSRSLKKGESRDTTVDLGQYKSYKDMRKNVNPKAQ